MPNYIILHDTTTNVKTTLSGTASGQVPTWDNSNKIWVAAAQAGQTGSRPYQIAGYFTGSVVANELLMTFVADRAISLSNTNTQHQFWCVSPPNGSVDLRIFKRANTVGSSDVLAITATFSPTSASPNGLYAATAVTVNSANLTLNAGDVLKFMIGNFSDSNLSNIVCTIFAGS